MAFPLAFFAERPELSYYGNDPFLLQNSWASGLYESHNTLLFTPAGAGRKASNGFSEATQGNRVYTRQSKMQPAAVSWDIENPEGNEIYAWFRPHGQRFSRATVKVNGENWGRILAYRQNAIIPLGTGENTSLTVNMEAETISYSDAYFYSLNKEAAMSLAAKAQENRMEFTVFDDTRVQGRISAPQNGYLLTTIPYDSGWKIEIGGVRAYPEKFGGVFMKFPLMAGEHEISMRYTAPGFWPGAAISLISVALIMLKVKNSQGRG